ncbi:MAG: hypothetical protein ACT6QS_01620 [Flavobacteriales bacterium]
MKKLKKMVMSRNNKSLIIIVFLCTHVQFIHAQLTKKSLLYYVEEMKDSSVFYESLYIKNKRLFIRTDDQIKAEYGLDNFLDTKKSYPYTKSFVKKGANVYNPEVFYKKGKKSDQEKLRLYFSTSTDTIVEIDGTPPQMYWIIIPLPTKRYEIQTLADDTLIKLDNYTFTCYKVSIKAKDTTAGQWTDSAPYIPYLESRVIYIDKKYLIPVLIITNYLRKDGNNERSIIKISEIIDCSKSKVKNIGRKE